MKRRSLTTRAIAADTGTALALPSIATASLPATYERAKVALSICDRIDECKDWADKTAALASYAKQADDPTLHNFATRISARAIRRCGELLQQFQTGPDGGRPKGNGTGNDTVSQREAAAHAGMSKRQEVTAVRVASVPTEEFEAAVESDDPPTITRLAELGAKSQPKAPEKFPEATHIIGVLHELAAFCAEHPPAQVGLAVLPHEVKSLRADAEALDAWLREFLNHLPEATC
jgi:hypothetical protein